jgi:hypothetical protein
MIQGCRPTSQIAAMGDILMFGGQRRFSSSHGMTVQNPARRWCSMSSSKRAIASGVHTVG